MKYWPVSMLLQVSVNGSWLIGRLFDPHSGLRESLEVMSARLSPSLILVSIAKNETDYPFFVAKDPCGKAH